MPLPRRCGCRHGQPYIDYFCTGPIWATPHQTRRPGVGLGVGGVCRPPTGRSPPTDGETVVRYRWRQHHQRPRRGGSWGEPAGGAVRALTDAPDPVATARTLRTCATGE
ncbi:MAG: hypothetical protein U1U88_000952 [Lawsonella clevelandensis]